VRCGLRVEIHLHNVIEHVVSMSSRCTAWVYSVQGHICVFVLQSLTHTPHDHVFAALLNEVERRARGGGGGGKGGGGRGGTFDMF
jgi:hypothetical protein